MIGFAAVIIVVFGLVHLYLWKRLVRDPLRGVRARRAGGVVILLLAFLAPATLIGVRSGYAKWLAWPGYLWVALMFYLLVVLTALEIPRLVANLWLRSKAAPGVREAAARGGTADSRLGDSDRDDSYRETESPSHAGGASTNASAPSRPASANSTATGSPANPDSTAISTAAKATSTAAQATSTAAQATSSATNATSSAAQATSSATKGIAKANRTAIGTAADATSTGTSPTNAANPDSSPANPDSTKTSSPAEENTTAQNEPPGIDRRLLLARGAAIFAGLTAAGLTGYGVKNALGDPQLDRVHISLAKLPRAMDGTRLAVVSDIHLGPLTGVRHAERIVRLINSVDADIVCVVGDLVDGTVGELGRFAAPLADIRSRRGAYFVTGNHEYYSGYSEWVAEVARLGIRPLRNERLEVSGLDLAGVNDIGGAAFGDGPDFERALGDRDPARPVVLMAHQPIAAKEAAPFGVDLQVSGHTHGGQMVPFNLLVRLEQPVVSGLGKVDGVPVYVTNGAGFWGPPVRVGAPPQVTVIELRTL
ncbi:metallophosphoesterase [Actinoplanes sp. NPDC051346]|uniref:metallophosphoesterase n=1 Tax=Actinoplanes sp. NPDC051346 TaxID=3155048 RepID=UPI00341344DA